MSWLVRRMSELLRILDCDHTTPPGDSGGYLVVGQQIATRCSTGVLGYGAVFLTAGFWRPASSSPSPRSCNSIYLRDRRLANDGRSGCLWSPSRRGSANATGLMGAESDSASVVERIGDRIGPIGRRYFVSNGFDGALTGVGVTVGAYLSGVPDGFTVITIGLGGAVGLTTSGVWSVWEIECAEMRAELHDLEDAMLTDLSDTQIERNKTEQSGRPRPHERARAIVRARGAPRSVSVRGHTTLVAPGHHTLGRHRVLRAVRLRSVYGIDLSPAVVRRGDPNGRRWHRRRGHQHRPSLIDSSLVFHYDWNASLAAT